MEREKLGNRTKSKVRARVEHVFGMQKMTAGDLILRCIGLDRARAKIGLRNLAKEHAQVRYTFEIATFHCIGLSKGCLNTRKRG